MNDSGLTDDGNDRTAVDSFSHGVVQTADPIIGHSTSKEIKVLRFLVGVSLPLVLFEITTFIVVWLSGPGPGFHFGNAGDNLRNALAPYLLNFLGPLNIFVELLLLGLLPFIAAEQRQARPA